jgi:hypothetical protein
MSSGDSNIEVKFTARTDGVEQGAATAKDAIQNAVTQMREQFEGLGNAVKGIQAQISGVFGGLQAGFAQFNNVMFAVQNAIAGGSMFKEFVASSKRRRRRLSRWARRSASRPRRRATCAPRLPVWASASSRS